MFDTMRSERQAPRVRAAKTSPRVARRRREQRARIVSTAARRFADEGPSAVALERIADEADVARGTLYSHFPTKQSLLEAIVGPALDEELTALGRLRRLPAARALDGFLESYCELWRSHRDALRVAHRPDGVPLGRGLAKLHQRLLVEVNRLFARLNRARRLRGQNAALSGELVARLAVPLLEAGERHGAPAGFFVAAMRALLVEEPGRGV